MNPAAPSWSSPALQAANPAHALWRSALRRIPHLPQAFTLTDLLVTVAILSVLGAILVSSLAAMKEKSRLALCTANLGKVDRAVLDFSAENDHKLPAAAPGDNLSPWWFYKEQVKRYAGLTGESSPNDTVFACPSDRGYSDPAPFHLSRRFDFSSYVFNGVTLPGTPVPNIAGLPLSAIKEPKRTLLVMEWTAHAPLAWHQSKTGKENSPFYCDAKSVVGFLDGHVSFIPIYYDGYNPAYTQDPIAGYEYQYSPN
jgi:type II secretory pathway pseudopilin PulG